MSDLTQFVLGIYLGIFLIVALIGYFVKTLGPKDDYNPNARSGENDYDDRNRSNAC